jgi:hypothetical protein
MIAIGYLRDTRQGPLDRIGIGAGPIAADDFNFLVPFEPGQDRLSRAVRQQIEGLARLDVDENRSIAIPTFQRSGKGNGVAAIPSPKNCTGRFLYIRLKPFSAPVSPETVSPRVNPGYECVDGSWDGVRPDSQPDLILLLIAIIYDDCAIR